MSDWITGVFEGAANLYDSRENRQNAQLQTEYSAMQQERFLQNQTQWKVNDAKAAGIHPLYALGAPSATFAPAPVSFDSGVGRAGEAIARGFREHYANQRQDQRDAQDREWRQLQGEVLRSEVNRNNAEAQRHMALANQALATQPGRAAPAGGGYAQDIETGVLVPTQGSGSAVPGQNAAGGSSKSVQVVPSQQRAVNPKRHDKVAATNAGWAEYVVDNRSGKYPLKVLAPYNEEGWTEGIESLPNTMYPMFIKKNVNEYGWKWLYDFFIRSGGDKVPQFKRAAPVQKRFTKGGIKTIIKERR